MLRRSQLDGVRSLKALSDVVAASGWGSFISGFEDYDPAELQDSIAQIQVSIQPPTPTDIDPKDFVSARFSDLPNVEATVTALNEYLDYPIKRNQSGRYDVNTLPVALIYWIELVGLPRLQQASINN